VKWGSFFFKRAVNQHRILDLALSQSSFDSQSGFFNGTLHGLVVLAVAVCESSTRR